MFDPELVLANVPACLVQRPQWVCWKFVMRDDKACKVPVNPRTGNFADSTDPATWGSFEEAMRGCERFAFIEGIGFVFTAGDEFAGIDLDDCRSVQSGEISPWGQRIIENMNSYSEVSPSGGGVKIFIRGRKPGSR